MQTAIAPGAWGQDKKPLTNDDVIGLVKSGLAESVVVSSIKSQPGNYDTSPAGLIAMHKAGVSPAEMDAIMAVTNGTASEPAVGAAATPAGAQPSSEALAALMPIAANSPVYVMPTVALVKDDNSQAIALEKSQIVQTKSKANTMSGLASDSVMAQALQSGMTTAGMGLAMHTGSGMAGMGVMQAGSVFSGMMSRKKTTPTVTYVWGLTNAASANVVKDFSPSFAVNFSKAPGVNLDDYVPAIVKLTPSQNAYRLVGATQGKTDQGTDAAMDWPVYSGYIEDRVPIDAQKSKPGQYTVKPSTPLVPGEYALVLRPISKDKKFSGADVARAQGDGFMFNAVWSFEVAAQ